MRRGRKAGRKNVAASVCARLLNQARQGGGEFQALLTSFCLERFLYRLSVSGLRDRFVLKGAMLLRLWSDQPYRATRDRDRKEKGRRDLEGAYAQLFAQVGNFIRYFKIVKTKGAREDLEKSMAKFADLYQHVVAIRIRETDQDALTRVTGLMQKLSQLGVDRVMEISGELYADLNGILDYRVRAWRKEDGEEDAAIETSSETGEYLAGSFSPDAPAMALETVEPNFDTMSTEAARIMNTLWNFNRSHVADGRPADWGFMARPHHPNYASFVVGAGELTKAGLVRFSRRGLVGLTDQGCRFGLEHNPEGDQYEGFGPLE